MIIAVDCYESGTYSTGVGQSIENVLKELVPMMPNEEFIALSREPIEKYMPSSVTQYVLSPDKGYFRWQNGPFRRKLKQIQALPSIAQGSHAFRWSRYTALRTGDPGSYRGRIVADKRAPSWG